MNFCHTTRPITKSGTLTTKKEQQMTVSCPKCKKSYPISDGDNPDNYACECGGKLYLDPDKYPNEIIENEIIEYEINELVDEKEDSFVLRSFTILKVLIIFPATVAFFWIFTLMGRAWKREDFADAFGYAFAMLAVALLCYLYIVILSWLRGVFRNTLLITKLLTTSNDKSKK